MVVVTGWPRSGTSLLMQVLDAGGMTALVSRHARIGRAGNAHGLWEWGTGSRDPARVALHLDDPNACVKLLHPSLQRFIAAGYRPAGVLMTHRPLAAVVASRVKLLGSSPSEKELAGARDRTLADLRDADVRTYVVAPAALVDDPLPVVEGITRFLRDVGVTAHLSEAAMASVPQAEDWHER